MPFSKLKHLIWPATNITSPNFPDSLIFFRNGFITPVFTKK